MKNLTPTFALVLLMANFVFGQAVLIAPSTYGGNYRIKSDSTQIGLAQNWDPYLTRRGLGSNINEKSGLFYTYGIYDPLYLNVIGLTRFEIAKYQNVKYNVPVRLGEDAPAIRIKELSGITSNTEGYSVFISHGLTASNIISVRIIIEPEFDVKIAEEYTTSSGLQASLSFDNNNIEIFNKAGNSSGILSKPVKILITYMN
jgi:hypothetical protein